MNGSTPGLPVHHQLLEFTQTHVHRVGDAIQPSHPLSSPSPPAPNPSQHQGLFQWVNSSHEVAKVLEFQLQGYGFSSSHVWMWELDCKDSWAPKNWCLWTVVLQKTLESPLDCKDIQPVNPKGNQSWLFIGRTDAEAETRIHLMWRTDSLKKTLMLGKIEGGRRRGRQRMRWLPGITDSMDMSRVVSGSWWWTGKPSVLQSMELQRVGHDWVTELN